MIEIHSTTQPEVEQATLAPIFSNIPIYPAHEECVTTFPRKLFMLLELIDEGKITSQAIKWNSDGKSFIISQRSEFCDTLLPQYFQRK